MFIYLFLLGFYFGIDMRIVMLPASVYTLFMNSFYIAQFCAAALAVRERFRLLNKNLEKFVNIETKTKAVNEHYKRNIQCINFDKEISFAIFDDFHLQNISQFYNKLCDLIEILNSTFTLQLVFVMISITIVDIFAAYGIICEFLTNQSIRLKFLIIGNSTWISVQCAIKFFMAHCGSSTTNEAEKSLIIVSKLADRINEKDLKTEASLNLVITQMRVRNKNLENVFFTINYKLILAVSFLN